MKLTKKDKELIQQLIEWTLTDLDDLELEKKLVKLNEKLEKGF